MNANEERSRMWLSAISTIAGIDQDLRRIAGLILDVRDDREKVRGAADGVAEMAEGFAMILKGDPRLAQVEWIRDTARACALGGDQGPFLDSLRAYLDTDEPTH